MKILCKNSCVFENKHFFISFFFHLPGGVQEADDGVCRHIEVRGVPTEGPFQVLAPQGPALYESVVELQGSTERLVGFFSPTCRAAATCLDTIL